MSIEYPNGGRMVADNAGVCSHCGALVARSRQPQHSAWHESQERSINLIAAALAATMRVIAATQTGEEELAATHIREVARYLDRLAA